MKGEIVLVSAIVSTYNSERFIKGKIEDLISQSIFPQIEIIVVVSGSKQQEEKIVRQYTDKYSNIILIVTKERESIYASWNRAIRISKGKYITNANTDDRLKTDAYEIMVNYLEQDLSTGLIYADQYYSFRENETFSELKKKIKYPKPEFSYILLLERCIIGSQPIWRRKIHSEDGIWFNEKYEIGGDYDFELKIAKKYKIVHLPIYLGLYYKSPNKTNKEYENSNITFNETVEIMSIYTREFLNHLSTLKFSEYCKKFKFFLFIPPRIYNKLYSFIRQFFPRYEIHSRQFRVWFLSFAHEKQARTDQAVKLCTTFLRKNNSRLIEERLNQLTHLG